MTAKMEKSKKNKKTASPKAAVGTTVVSTSTPKKRGRSPKKTPTTKKSPATKPSSGKKRTPVKKETSTPVSKKKSPKTKSSNSKKTTPGKKNDFSTPLSTKKKSTPVLLDSGKKRKTTPVKNSKNPTNAKTGQTPSKSPSHIEATSTKKRKRTKDSKSPTSESRSKTDIKHKRIKHKSNKKSKGNGEAKEAPALDARVHRLRHLGYIPGSISAFTPTSTKDGQVVAARTDGSYELKSITSSSTSGYHYPNDPSSPRHRLITIAETAPITGRKPVSDDDDNDDYSDEENNSINGAPESCPDAASSLCWVHASSTPICVGSGPNGNIWVVDFNHSTPISVVSSGGGGIFDLATCGFGGDPAVGVKSLPFVAGACEDGSVRIWRVALGSTGRGEIRDPPLVSLPSAGAPVLSLAWKNVAVLQQGKTKTFQTVVFAAVADGTIRKYGLEIEEQSTSIDQSHGKSNSDEWTDSQNQYTVPNPPKSILRMTIENKGRKDPTKVWTLRLLQDNTLVAGNSLGQVQFWNGETGTLTQTIIQSNSQADVLKVAVNSDETKLFCSGVDSRVVCLERKKPPIITSTPPASELTALVTSHLTSYRPWKMTISQRPHTHDVKAMAIVTSNSNTLSMSTAIETLLTGGVDTKICSYSVSTFAHTQPQIWYPWPSATSLFSSTRTTRRPNGSMKLLSMQRHDCIELYQLETLEKEKKAKSRPTKEVSAQFPTSIPLGKIRLGESDSGADHADDETFQSSSSPLRASSLSASGEFLAVSNATSTYLFHLNYESKNDGSVRLKPEKLILPEEVENVSATTISFHGDELLIGESSSGQKVHVIRLPSGDDKGSDQMDVEGERESDTKLIVQTVSLPEPVFSSKGGEISLPIQAIHACREFLVTVSHARENAVHVFRRNKKTEPYEHFWTIPQLGGRADSRPAAVSIMSNNRLAVATYRSHLYVLDIETKSLNEWSEQYGFPIREKKWTEDALCGRGYPLRLIPQPNGSLIIASFGTLSVIDLKKPVPRLCRAIPKRPAWKNRRKFKAIIHDGDDNDDDDDHWLEPRITKVVEDEYSHNETCVDGGDANSNLFTSPLKPSSNQTSVQEASDEVPSRNCTICSHFKNMLYADFITPTEMVVVEQPWLDIVETFPAALQRRIYGAD